MWILLGFLTVAIPNTPDRHSSYNLGEFSSRQKCLDEGEKWKKIHDNTYTEAQYICEPNLPIGKKNEQTV
jgi:hypothetical protein